MKGHRLTCPGIRQIEVEEFELGPLPDDGILVRQDYTAVSIGTELYGWVHGADPGMQHRFPRQTGYCSAGTVLETGTAVSGVKPGDRVAGEGRHANHAVMTNPNLYQVIPDAVPSRAAAFMVMAAVALRGVRVARIELGECVAVQGLGLIGQFAASLARLAGGTPMIGIDVDEFRLNRAKARGAGVCIDPSQAPDLPAAVREHCIEDGVNVLIEATGKPATYPTAVKLVAYAGRMVALGNPRGTVEMNFDYEVMRREVKILGAPQPQTPEQDHIYYHWTRRRERGLIMRLMAEGRLQVEDLITHEARPEQCQDVYTMLADQPRDTLGVLFDWRDTP